VSSPRRSARPHQVKTKHPKYIVPVYERGRGNALFSLPPERFELPLDNPEGAKSTINEMEKDWESAGVVDRQVMLQTMKQGAMQSQRLMSSGTVVDPADQMKVYKTNLIYTRAYQAFGARLQMV